MTTKIMQRLAGKVSVLIMVALLIAAVGTYGLSNSKHESTGRATASVTPSSVEKAPVANTPVAKAAGTVKAVDVSVRTSTTQPSSSTASTAPPVHVTTVTAAPPEVARQHAAPLQEAKATYAKLPLSFIPNQGQLETGVAYEARGSGYNALLTADAAYVGLHRPSAGKGQPAQQALVRFGFAGASQLNYQAGEKQASYANYIGGPASHWRQHVPNYGRLTAAEVYPGIDTTFYGNQSNLQFDFVVKPGADPSVIQMKIDGGTVKLDQNGDLAISTELGAIYQRKPVLYQLEANGNRQQVEGGYKVDGDRVTFEVGAYDAQRTLVIDPIVNFSAVVGGLAGVAGVGDSALNAVAFDQGAVYVTGTSTATTLNLTGAPGNASISPVRAATSQSDAIVVSFTRNGSVVNWYTYIGGSGEDTGTGIAVEDDTFNGTAVGGFPNAQYGIYVVGQTFSSDFAVNALAGNGPYTGNGAGWVIRLNGTGFQTAGPFYLATSSTGSTAATSVAVRCAGGGGCAANASENDVYVGLSTSAGISNPVFPTVHGGFAGTNSGAIADLTATTLAPQNLLYVASTAAGAQVNALALWPFRYAGPAATATLVPPSRLLFAGTTGSGLVGVVNGVQGTIGSSTTGGFWGVTNTGLSGAAPLSTVGNLDYIGNPSAGAITQVNGVDALPDGNMVVVGTTNWLPATTPAPGGVLGSALAPVQNVSGTPDFPHSRTDTDVFAAVINPGVAAASLTANLGVQAVATANLGVTAAATIPSLGTQATAVVTNGANPANFAGDATATATLGTTVTATVTAGIPATVTPVLGVQLAATANNGQQAVITATQGTTPSLTTTQGIQATGTVFVNGGVVVSVTMNNTGSGYPPSVNNIPVVFTATGCTTTPTGFGNTNGAGQVVSVSLTGNGTSGCTTSSITFDTAGITAINFTAGTGVYDTNNPAAFPTAFVNGCSNVLGAIEPTGVLQFSAGPAPFTITGVTLTGSGLGCNSAPTYTFPAPGITYAITTPGTAYGVVPAIGSGIALTGTTCTTNPVFTVTNGAANGGLSGLAQTDAGFNCTAVANPVIEAPGIVSVTVTTAGTAYQSAPSVSLTTPANCTTDPTFSVVAPTAGNLALGNNTITTAPAFGVGCIATPALTIGAPGIASVTVPGGSSGNGYACSPASTPGCPLTAPGEPGPPSTSSLPPIVITGCATQPVLTSVVNLASNVTSVSVSGTNFGACAGPVTVTMPAPGILQSATLAPPAGGTGYSSNPLPPVVISGGPCSGIEPTAVANVNGTGAFTGLTITNPGSGCTGNPTVTIPTAGVASYTVTSGGGGYVSAPVVTVTLGGTPNCTQEPAATSTIAGGVVNAVTSVSGSNYTGGYGCSSNPTVMIAGPGLVGPTNSSITVTNGGSGYSSANPPTATISGGGCSVEPAAGTPVVSAGGAITSIPVTVLGSGCTGTPAFSVSITPPGLAVGTALTVVTPGSGYDSAPVITVQAAICTVNPTFNVTMAPTTGVNESVTGITVASSGTGCASIPTLTFSSPGITSVTVTTAGTTYDTAPTFSFSGGGCSSEPIAGTAVLTGGTVTSLPITDSGNGCSSAPNVSINGPGVASVTIVSGGGGYTVAPTVVFTGGCGIEPSFNATVLNGVITAVTLNNTVEFPNGVNCTSAPTISLSSPIPSTPRFTILDYLGGTGNDYGNGLAVDVSSYMYLTGSTASTNFPVLNALASSAAPTGSSTANCDANTFGSIVSGAAGPGCVGFISRLPECLNPLATGAAVCTPLAASPSAVSLGGFSTYAAGANDLLNGGAVDPSKNFFAVGQTYSSAFPVTVGSPFSGNSDGTIINLFFNDMSIAPVSPAVVPPSFTGAYNTGTLTAQNFNVNFTAIPQTFTVTAGAYSANSTIQWLTIIPTVGGFQLGATTGVGANALPPDVYTVPITVTCTGAACDSTPLTVTVTLTVTGSFLPNSSAFTFSYFKLENTGAAINLGDVLTQNLNVGLSGATNTIPAVYPASGFMATVNYNTNHAFIQNPVTGAVPIAATNTNFQWFTVGTINGGICTAPCSAEAFASNLAITIVPSVLDQLWESSTAGTAGTGSAQGTIMLTLPCSSQNPPAGCAVATITVTANVTPRVVIAPDATTVTYNYDCVAGGAPPNPCTSSQPSVTNRLLLRAENDVINIVGHNNLNKIASLSIATTPPGGNSACFTSGGGGVFVPANPGGTPYAAPSSSDPVTSDLGLPVDIVINNGNATCVQGVYTGTLSITTQGTDGALTGGLGGGDTVRTAGLNINAFGPPDPPASLGTLSVPIVITLGNEFQSSATSFTFNNYVLNDIQNMSPPAFNLLPTLPAAMVSETIGGVASAYQVTCSTNSVGPNVVTGFLGYTGVSSSTGNCGWFSVTNASGNLAAAAGSNASITVALSPAGVLGLLNPGFNGQSPITFSGVIQICATGACTAPGSGSIPNNSLTYPVSFTIVRQPLTWAANAPNPTISVVVGSGVPASQPCGTLVSNETEWVHNGNSVPILLNLSTASAQTYVGGSLTNLSGTSATQGWLTVTSSGSVGSSPGTGLTCSANIFNLAVGTYTATIDAFADPATNPGNIWGIPGGTSYTRQTQTVTLVILPAPPLTPSQVSYQFNWEVGQPAPPSQTLTLTNGAAAGSGENIQNVTASVLPVSGGNWLSVSSNGSCAAGSTAAAVNFPSIAAAGSSNVTLCVNPTGLTQNTYLADITVTAANANPPTQTILVSLTVTSAPIISTVPGTLAQFTYQMGGALPAAQNLAVVLSSIPVPTVNYTVAATSTGNWLTVTGAGGTPLTGPLTASSLGFQVSTNLAALQALTPSNVPYTGMVTVTVPTATNSPVTLMVSVLVLPQPTLTLTPSPAGFAYTVGGIIPSAQTLSVGVTNSIGAAVTAGYTASVSGCSSTATGGPADPFTLNGGAGPVTNIASTLTPVPLTVGATVTGITAAMAGTYSCTLTLATPGASGGAPAISGLSFPLSLVVSATPLITVSGCTGNSFAYTLTQPSTTPANITCTVSNSSSVSSITNLAVASGCPASWETCTFPTGFSGTLAPSGSTTLTITPANLANQNPGTFGPANLVLSGLSGGNPIPNSTGTPVTLTNTPLTVLTPNTGLVFGGSTGYTQGNLATPGNQAVTGVLNEGTGGTPAGPGSVGTGTLTSAVAASSFLAGACSNGVTAPPNWVAVTQTGSGNMATFTIAVNPAVFPTLTVASTTCSGTINVNSTGVTPAAAQQTIPVTFTMNAAPGFQTSPTAFGPYTIVSGYPTNLTSTAGPTPVIVTSNPIQGQSYTVTIQQVSGGAWLLANGSSSPISGVTATGTTGFTLSVAPSANTLNPAGSPYYATVTVAPANSSQPVNTPPLVFTVALNVDAETGLTVIGTPALAGGSFSLGPHVIDFTTPGSQALAVTTTSASAGAPATPATFTVSNAPNAGSAGLLLINGSTTTFTGNTTGTATPTSVTLTYSAAVANTLAPGVYGGTVTVTVTQAGVNTAPQFIAIPWTITVDAEATIQTTPTAAQGIVITCISGFTCTSTVSVAATSTGMNVNIPIGVSTSAEPTPWLTATGTVPATANSDSITLSANTAGLQANTSYAGQVVVTSASASDSPYIVPVTLNVVPFTCTFSFVGGSTASLGSSGTATTTTIPGGALPEVPVTVTITATPNTNCNASGSFYTAQVTSGASWLTITTSGNTFTYTALSNANSTAKTATITVTNSLSTPPYAQTFTVTEAGDTETETFREVRALYQSILFRDPDVGGFQFWTNVGAAGLGQMTDSFTTSPEAFTSDFGVMAAYQGATGGPPLYAEFSAMVASIKAGTQTIPGLFSSLIATNSGYSAATLYQNLLNRAATSAEITACNQAGLATCFEDIVGLNPTPTAAPVSVPSNEFQSTCGTSACIGVAGISHAATGDHSNNLYVYMLYFVILDRDPDSGGLQFWLGVANSGGPGILFQGAAGFSTRIQILGPGTPNQGMTGSPEFLSKFQ